MDPLEDNDGNPYAPKRFKELVKSTYRISKNCSTSYNEVLLMTPRERDLILEFMNEEIKELQEIRNRRNNE